MVLATHAIVGGAIGRVLASEPILALSLGFISHFLLDAIPHWDYKLNLINRDKIDPLNTFIRLDRNLAYDCFKLGADISIGLMVGWLAFGGSTQAWPAILAGAAGGVLPDFLQFIYFRFRWQSLKFFQRFHRLIHAKVRLDGRPALGIFLQAAISIAMIIVARAF